MSLLGDKAEKFSTEDSPKNQPGIASLMVGLVGGTLLTWLVVTFLGSTLFELAVSRLELGNWIWPIAIAGGIVLAGFLHHLDSKRKKG